MVGRGLKVSKETISEGLKDREKIFIRRMGKGDPCDMVVEHLLKLWASATRKLE